MKYINPETGEVLTEDSPIEDLAQLRKVYSMKIKEYKKIVDEVTDILRPHFESSYEMGEKEFAGYWKMSVSAPKFDKNKFEEEADTIDKVNYDNWTESLKELKAKYQKPGSVYLKFPRLS